MNDDGGLQFWQQQAQQEEQLHMADMFRSLFEYKDGDLFWRVKKGRSKVGMIVRGRSANGYYRVGIDRKIYLVHRVIYAMFHNDFPEIVDHIDNNTINNRIENLRPANKQKNNWNERLKSTNKSGVKGVSWHKKAKKWQAHIRTNKGNIYLGVFSSITDAENAVKAERRNSHREFANNGQGAGI